MASLAASFSGLARLGSFFMSSHSYRLPKTVSVTFTDDNNPTSQDFPRGDAFLLAFGRRLTICCFAFFVCSFLETWCEVHSLPDALGLKSFYSYNLITKINSACKESPSPPSHECDTFFDSLFHTLIVFRLTKLSCE